MSAAFASLAQALAVLPRMWATAGRASSQKQDRPGTCRKGPHRLVLVRTQAGVRTAPAVRLAPAPALTLAPAPAATGAPELAFYRKYTEALLRRYMKLSMESGRVPSLLGRELFGGGAGHSKVKSFEDVVIFVLDVERCLETLSLGQRHLLRRIALEEYTQGETSAMLGISLRTVVRRYAEALDAVTRLLLERGLLRGVLEQDMEAGESTCGKSCQALQVRAVGISSSLQAG